MKTDKFARPDRCRRTFRAMLRLTLDALQTLDAIARRGSFAAAGEELHRTASTLSYTVKKLEDDLGVQVFDRSGHRAVLTPAGRLLLEDGRAVLDAAQAVERRVRTLGQGWEPELTIAVNDLVPETPVLAAVAAFYAAGHPTRIHLLREVLGGVWEALLSGRADVALTEVGPGATDALAHRPVGHVSFVFAVPPGHPLCRAKAPLRAAAIARHRIVVVADSAREAPRRSSGITLAADVLTVPSLQAKLAAQLAGLGVGFLPAALAARPVAEGRLVALEVAAPKPQLPLSVAWRAADAGPAAQWFAQRLAQIDPNAPA
jgi:DNA-binding transcriptional LysR family regulator